MCLLKHKTVTTRKTHRCLGCNSIIAKGAKVTYSVGVNSENFWAVYICKICQSFIDSDAFSWRDHEEGIGYGDLYNYPSYKKFREDFIKSAVKQVLKNYEKYMDI